MARVSFGSRTIQKLKRVSLNHSLLDNLNVSEGDTVDLYFDTDEIAVVIKKSRKGNKKVSSVNQVGQQNENC